MRILYIHNRKNWAIHNVGKLWFEKARNTHQIDFIDHHTIGDQSIFEKYDLIWFGYYFIYTKYNYKPSQSIVAIHDPMELFPEKPNWKKLGIVEDRLKILKQLPNIVTISNEMHTLLNLSKVKNTLIPTNSLLPLRQINDIQTTKCEIHSVFQTYPRKNPELIEQLKIISGEMGLEFHTKIGLKILPQREYVKLLDQHEIYICTSFQEGGPLPAMDAMRRGSVVISTPVGQIQEIINNGVNGYICETRSNFVKAIKHLSTNLDELHRMRLNSIRSIKGARNNKNIQETVASFLDSL